MFNGAVGPLDEAEFNELCDCLDAFAELDYGGFIGLLHAIALAPGVIPPSSWLELLLPHGFDGMNQEDTSVMLGLIMRQYNDVMNAVARRELLVPESDDADGCASFAIGYTLGAALDDEWIGYDDRWSFVTPLAFLAGRRELIPSDLLKKMEADPIVEQNIRDDLAALLFSTKDSFMKLRKAPPAATGSEAAHKVGRNDPCPCGSGKKHKRCCGAPSAGAAN